MENFLITKHISALSIPATKLHYYYNGYIIAFGYNQNELFFYGLQDKRMPTLYTDEYHPRPVWTKSESGYNFNPHLISICSKNVLDAIQSSVYDVNGKFIDKEYMIPLEEMSKTLDDCYCQKIALQEIEDIYHNNNKEFFNHYIIKPIIIKPKRPDRRTPKEIKQEAKAIKQEVKASIIDKKLKQKAIIIEKKQKAKAEANAIKQEEEKQALAYRNSVEDPNFRKYLKSIGELKTYPKSDNDIYTK